jgi:hypothetical protein
MACALVTRLHNRHERLAETVRQALERQTLERIRRNRRLRLRTQDTARVMPRLSAPTGSKVHITALKGLHSPLQQILRQRTTTSAHENGGLRLRCNGEAPHAQAKP